jgi:serine/threonine-protein kinase RIO1
MPADEPAATDSLDEESSRIIEEFESAWRHGRPDVAQHFSRHSRRPTRLLFELAAIDFENRLERGEAVAAADYTSRFPELAADLRAIRNLSRRAERLADEAAAHAPTSALSGEIRDRGIVGAEPDASRPAVTPRQDSLVGSRIGGVSIVRVIAEGGMGRVYEGRQDKPRRPVAVKIIKPGLVSPSLLKRFDYEAQVLGRLRHPGVAQIYTVGTHDVGGQPVPYFVMEYVPNAKTLTQYANDNRLSTHDRLELFRRVCEAVAHGHQKGVIHRDLKPGNILVDASGQPKVIDFGVARSTDSDMALTTMQTDIGALVGTLQYMSPEQFDADPSDLDVRLDVYALGVVLYELLTGKPPYDVRQRAIHEIARVVRERDPTPLSTLDKTLRRDVAIIAGKCLQKDRNRRYSSATELAGDVGRYLAGEPITAAPPGFFDAVTRVARRHKAAAAAVAGIALSLVAAVVGISAFAIRAERARDDASTQRDLADREREAATRARDAEKQRADELKQVSDFQSRMLRQIDTTAAGRD